MILHQLKYSCKSAPAKADRHPPPTLVYKPHLSSEQFRKENLTHLIFFFCCYTKKKIVLILLSENAIISVAVFTLNKILQKLHLSLE